MKKPVILIVLISFCLLGNAQVNSKTMPVTTSSKKALALYNEAMRAYEDVDLNKFSDLTTKAITEDSDFFMAYYQKAMFAAYLNQEKNFIKFGTAAVNCKSKLRPGEKVLQDAVKLLLDNRSADLTGFGKKLVEMYPKDVNSYLNLSMFQYFKKDFDGEISTLNNALNISDRKDFIYNALAYAYMEKAQFKDAEAALDKYIALSPQLPNPYDSKGDLYMRTKEYTKAYENFMKANNIDTAWSKGKALRAKSMADQLKQTDSMRKLVGTWQSGSGKDTVDVCEMIEYNNALLQINSRIIKGMKRLLFTSTYTFDPASGSFQSTAVWPNGRSEIWRARFTSDKDVDFSRVEDMKATTVMYHNTCTFDTPDQFTANYYNIDNVRTGTSKWVRTSANGSVPKLNNNVDQLALMQSMVGHWRGDVGKETEFYSEIKREGNIFTDNTYNVIKGEKTFRFTQNIIYSEKDGRFRSFVAYPNGNYLTYIASFNSDKKWIGSFLRDFNPNEVTQNWELSFPDANHKVVIYFNQDGSKAREIRWNRVE